MTTSHTHSQDSSRPWWSQLSGYHWFVFVVASLAWFFDCLDQRLFSLARIPALKELMPGTSQSGIQAMGKDVTALFLVGWGIGGMVFGALGDRYGRSRMLTVTVLIYSLFTGLSFFSHYYWDFALFRFLTGVGVGGVFGLAVALIAETVPAGARAGALGTLQVLSTVGNISASFIKMGIDSLEKGGSIPPNHGWRYLFLVGAVPALLVIFIQKYLREPEPWLKLKAEGRLPAGSIFSPYVALLGDKKWRSNLIIGAVIASTGVIGLWAIGEYAVDLQDVVFKQHFLSLGVDPAQVAGKVSDAKNLAFLLNMLGGAVGMSVFTWMCGVLGRRKSFVIGFSAALVVTALVYKNVTTPTQAMWMMPLMGAVQLGPLAGFSIYLPELFPSRLRSTGISFCYNLGRFAAAAGSLFSARLATDVFAKSGVPDNLRYSAITMCAIFIVGIVAVIWAPETKGQPLPED
ncbi:MFS transporter [Luteolibacter ambystomatis]|uniref:MFS transporter n=1 Tax=Luteolibacter ambystomatis TaxID=2824561 RepID=A0A975PFM0_9BACT|nr:MFS transporter [Luteolibacter ambystomatis]QUE52104.1 MFS transporter [Luteolibacter ambystomatis]